jgi:hypothetical protein
VSLNTSSLQNLLVAALFGALAFTPTGVKAGEIGHYAGGLMNLRDYFVPDPGFYAAVYNYGYTTDQLNDSHGNKVKSVTINPPGGGGPVTVGVDVNVDMYILAPTLIYALDVPSLGIRYGALITPTFGNANLDAALSTVSGHGGKAEASNMGVGDMYVQPVWLGKTFKHLELALAYGFFAPIGEYDTATFTLPGGATVKAEAADNIGFGFWTQLIQGSAAWYPLDHKGTAVIAALTYETNGKKKDFDLTPGDNLTLNWGISQFLPLKKDMSVMLEVGPAGYDTWQITDDSGSAANDTRDQVHAVGGQLGLVYMPWHTALTCHGYYEYAAKDRFQGGVFNVSIVKKF